MTVGKEFLQLRDTPLHALRGSEWDTFYAQMTPYLKNDSPDVREMAVERLAMAVFRAHKQDAVSDTERAFWLLKELEDAHTCNTDVLPTFLRELRWHGDDGVFPAVLLPWLNRLMADRRPGIDTGLIKGAQLMLAPKQDDDVRQAEEWIRLLDDPSDWVRGCAARLLPFICDDKNTSGLLDLVANREIARPGIAGPFCSDCYSGSAFDIWGDEAGLTEWLMNLLERRRGPLPADMPFNDIEFYLHELCRHSPAHVRRMIDGGFLKLALMTATEDPDCLSTMAPLIQELNASENNGDGYTKQ